MPPLTPLLEISLNNTTRNTALLSLALMALAGCGSADSPEAAATLAEESSAPYENIGTVKDLMRGTITLSTEVYWESVAVVIDIDGETVHKPESDLEWFEVWSAALTVAESGNLLMMPGRAIDDGEWMRWSAALRDVGKQAAEAALDKDYEGVLNIGGDLYDTCVGCHRLYVPAMDDL